MWVSVRRVIVFGAMVLCVCGAWAQDEFDDASCMLCHGDPELTKTTPEGEVISLYIDQEVYDQSLHAPLGCVMCHADIAELPHEPVLSRVDCGQCHVETEEYANSVHGIALAEGSGDVSGCVDCHGAHDIRATEDVLSRVHPLNLPKTCGECHSNPTIMKEHMVTVVDPSQSYLKSVHARVNETGDQHAASCSDCHGSHDIHPAFDPASPAYRRNIAQTCGQCHEQELADFEASIHGIAFAEGISDAPTCTDCHGEHEILGPEEEGSPLGPVTISRSTCPQCHSDEEVMTKYGIPVRRQASYMDSYHGLGTVTGGETQASCISCHGVHKILPEADPASSINPANLAATCAQCHPDAGPNFAKGKVHIVPTDPSQTAVSIVRLVYLWLIGLLLGGMAIHNLLLLGRHMVAKFRAEKGAKQHKRFSKGHVVGHIVLILSFVVLVLSGFALRYPEALWARMLFEGPGFEIRSAIHRWAGAVMIALTIVNFSYIFLFRKGRREMMDLFPKWKDVKDGFTNLGYGLGLTKKRPQFDRFGYIEKLEYWGLWWGAVLMGITGLAMWFADEFLRYFPKWVLDVFGVIHFYEAWLALGTIVIWHLYFVMFSPTAYPMNWTWVSGKITDEQYKHHHPLQYKREVEGASKPDEKKDDDSAPAK